MMRKTLTTVTFGCFLALTTGCATVSSPLERGLAHYQDGNYSFAAAEFNDAVRQDPRSVDAYVNRAVARARLGQLNAAIDDYNRAIQLDSDDPVIYFNRGNALVAAGQYGPAIEDFTRAGEPSQTFGRAWFNRGSNLVYLQDYACAAQAYEMLLRKASLSSRPVVPFNLTEWRQAWCSTTSALPLVVGTRPSCRICGSSGP